MALVPLSADDELLNNAGFELSQTGTFGTEFTDWDIPLGMAAAETTDKVEGAQALKTVEVTLTKAYVQQAVSTLGTDDVLLLGRSQLIRARIQIIYPLDARNTLYLVDARIAEIEIADRSHDGRMTFTG